MKTIVARLAAARERLAAAYAGIEPFMPRLVSGAVRDIVLREARKKRVELLAMGTHGREGAAEMVLGSVARDVLARGSSDVLVVSRPRSG